MKKTLFFFSLLLISSFILSFAGNKSAIVSDTLKSHSLKEVVIISSSKETNDLNSLPGSVSVLSPSQIDGMKINSIKDISTIVPNFFIPDYGSKLSTPVYVRGLGNRSTGQSIGLYVDNMPYLDKTTFDFDFTDIQRIEVLRGPQGTLYGRNAMGGIVNIFTHSPLNYNQTKVTLTTGNYGLMQAKATISHRLDDKTGISVGGYYDSNDGFVTNQYTGEKADASNAAGGRFRLDWRASKNLKFQYVLNYDYSDQGAFPYGEYKDGKISDPNYNSEGSYRREVVGNGLNITFENKHIVLNSSTNYQYFKDNMKMDTDYSPLSFFSLNQKQQQNAFTEEINIKSNHRKNYQWSFGLMGFYDDLKVSAPTTFGQDGVKYLLSPMINMGSKVNPNAPVFEITDETVLVPGDFGTPSSGVSLFHQSTYNNLFIKGLSATVGIRVDYEKVKLDYNSSMPIDVVMKFPSNPRIPATPMVLDSVLQGNVSTDYVNVLPKLALKYEFGNNKYIYASAANGYKSGGYNVNMFADLTENAFRSKYDKTYKNTLSVQDAAYYKPEYSWNYELGFKGELVKDFLYTEIAGFYIDSKDIQLTQFVQSGQGRILTNAEKGESYGAEIALTANLCDGFSLSASYGYTHATFKQYQPNDSTDYSGKSIPYAPQNTFSVSAVYNKNFHNKVIDNFNLQASYNGAGKIYWTEKNDSFQDIYGLLNMKASVSKGFFGLAFWMKNILNEEYATFYFESMNNRNLTQKGKPMQLGLDINVKF